jgi:hypothetical protein
MPVSRFPHDEGARIVVTNQTQKSITAALEEALGLPSATVAPPKEPWRPVAIVVSPRPTSGKTFLARLLTDFFSIDYGEVEAFDLGGGDHPLAASRPRVTTRCGIESTENQIALFDRLVVKDRIAKVVDVGHESFARLFTVIEEIGFLEETRRREVEVVMLFAADAHPTSAQAYRALQHRFPDMVLVPMFNEGILRGQKIRDDYRVARASAVPLQLTILPPGLGTYVENTDSTFAEFHDFLPIAVPIGRALDLRAWTRRTFIEFRELELRILLEKVRASLAETGSPRTGQRRASDAFLK